MGMDLEGTGGYFRWNSLQWIEILNLGRQFGWEPTGTGPSRGQLKADSPEENYYGNDGQLFYARDAKKLADALERALQAWKQRSVTTFPTQPSRSSARENSVDRKRDAAGLEHARQMYKLIASLTPVKKSVRRPRANQESLRSEIESWLVSAEGQRYVRKFIRYCRQGGFRIF